VIIYDILLVLQYQVSTAVMGLVFVFALFVLMLALLCFSVATVFPVNKDLHIGLPWSVSDDRHTVFNNSLSSCYFCAAW